MAKISLDQAVNAERLQRAEEEKTAGLLNVIKALKDIQSMDLANIEHSLNILQGVEQATEQIQQP
jgi:hypothetical protein